MDQSPHIGLPTPIIINQTARKSQITTVSERNNRYRSKHRISAFMWYCPCEILLSENDTFYQQIRHKSSDHVLFRQEYFSRNFHFARQFFIILSHFGIEKTVWSAQTAFKLYAIGILTQHLLQQRRNPQGNHCRLSSIVIVLYTAITSIIIEISDQVCMVLYRNKQKPSCMLVWLLLHRKTGYNQWL